MTGASSDDIADRIANYVVESLRYDGTPAGLLGDHPVRLTEATDSMGLLELATYVEEEFGIKIADEEISRENFATVADVVRLIRFKLDAASRLGTPE